MSDKRPRPSMSASAALLRQMKADEPGKHHCFVGSEERARAILAARAKARQR